MAPELPLHDQPEPGSPPRLVAFVRDWSLDRASTAELTAISARLRELDAELLVLSKAGAWSFTRDREIVFCDRLAGDVATAAMLYGVRPDAEAVFVIDGRNVVRFAHRPEEPLTASLLEALDTAGEALAARDRLTRLERVLFTRREWTVTSLVVGCTMVFVGRSVDHRAVRMDDARGAVVEKLGERLERRRFARGTGPVATCVASTSRGAITPCAPIGAALTIVPRETAARIEVPRVIPPVSPRSTTKPT
ncbi:MAG: hypothetical protein H0T89_13505 [Deltaproteobacteria bacterium]|nr:hypothetical protein [Deltaproteobacteria bacterium]MDQ3295451.1 hypothetical protein [Myxococcota bacterium]